MPNDNPLNEEPHPDPQKGDKIRNAKVRKSVVINGQEFNRSESSTQPGKNGVYDDIETTHIVTDSVGNPLPENSNFVAQSHTGLFITSPEQMDHCGFWLHPQNRSRIILVGQDGQHTETGAICSHCVSWQLTINILLFLMILGFFGGLLKAVGIF